MPRKFDCGDSPQIYVGHPSTADIEHEFNANCVRECCLHGELQTGKASPSVKALRLETPKSNFDSDRDRNRKVVCLTCCQQVTSN